MIDFSQLDERMPGLIEGDNFPLNLGDEFARIAGVRPESPAVILATGKKFNGKHRYETLTFRRCRELYEQYAYGLRDYGIQRGDTILLLMKPMLDLVPVVFALWKIGAVLLSVDPGASREQKLKCIEEIEAKGLIGIPLAHALRFLYPKTFRSITHPVVVGRRWFLRGPTLKSFLHKEAMGPLVSSQSMASDEIAIIFTSGSTGAPKGAIYTHGNGASVSQFMKRALDLGPDDKSLVCHPIFALYFVGLGNTVVIPDIDPRFPAKADPKVILEIIHDQKPTVSFMPPPILNNLYRYAINNNVKIPYLRRILTTGSPISLDLIQGLHKAFAVPHADVCSMYGSTEALSVSYADGNDILCDAATKMFDGKGTYLGRPVSGIKVRTISITDQSITDWRDAPVLSPGEIGEICVSGPTVTQKYKNRPDDTRMAKIHDSDTLWHRMGDVGCMDENGCIWYHGRIADRIKTKNGFLYPHLVEGIFDRHQQVSRSALVGIPSNDSSFKLPVVIIEPRAKTRNRKNKMELYQELKALAHSHPNTRIIEDILIYGETFPVDVRHNAKIRHDLLTDYAERELKEKDRATDFMNSVQFQGHTIYYYEKGSGEPLLFLHNAGNDHRIWDFQLKHFSRNYRVVALDNLGYGQSDSPKIDYTLPMYTEMVASVVEKLSLAPVTIIGNCTGSSMALNYGLKHSDKVKRLILFNIATGKTILGGNIEFNCRLLAGRPRLTKLLASFIEALMSLRLVTNLILRGQYGENPPKDHEFAEHIHHIYSRRGKMSSFLNLLCYWESLKSLDQITSRIDSLPVHVIWGKSNRVLPATRGREFCQKINPSTEDFIEGGGHLLMREKSELINARIDELLNNSGL